MLFLKIDSNFFFASGGSTYLPAIIFAVSETQQNG
jgi:hypothetical protein